MRELETLSKWINENNHIVFFGGAGVSTESGIPDFRSVDGLYNQKYDYPPEHIISHSFFMSNPQEFFRFYKDRMIYDDAKPNTTHQVLRELEKKGKLDCIITQNIDGLHQMAGSENVIELHGSIMRNYCMQCHSFYDKDKVVSAKDIPICDKCGGIIKPDVVLYEESLNYQDIENACSAIENADVLIVGGTSLVVQPAASLINYYRKNKMVLINRDATAYDHRANLVIHDSLGVVFKYIKEHLEG